MSQENVEIVRRAATQFVALQQPPEVVAPDVVFDMSSWSAWRGPELHGRDAFMEFFAEWTAAYEEWTQEFDSFVDAGGAQVLVTGRQRGRLPGSDSWVDLPVAYVYTVEDQRIVRVALFASTEDAREAAGLAEQK